MTVETTTNEFGGDTSWGDEDLPTIADDGSFDGDVIEGEYEESTETDAEEATDDEATEDETTDDDEESNDDADDADDESDDEADDESDDDADDDGPDDDDDSVADEASEDDIDGDKKDSGKVPRSRLNKEVAKRRELEQRIAQLEAGSGQQEQAPVDEKPVEAISLTEFKEMADALMDDDNELALEKFAAMTQKQVATAVAQAKTEAKSEARNEIEADKRQTSLSNAAVELGTKYPELDGQSDVADVGLIEEVIDLRGVYESRGLAPADALGKAVSMIAKENDLADRSAKPDMTDDKPKRKVKKPNVEKKMKMAKKETGKLGGEAGSNKKPKLDITKMSDSDFAKLSGDALKRARGDII